MSKVIRFPLSSGTTLSSNVTIPVPDRIVTMHVTGDASALASAEWWGLRAASYLAGFELAMDRRHFAYADRCAVLAARAAEYAATCARVSGVL